MTCIDLHDDICVHSQHMIKDHMQLTLLQNKGNLFIYESTSAEGLQGSVHGPTA